MTTKRRIRVRRGHQDAGEGVSPAYVERAVQEALAAAGVEEFRQWKDRVETELGEMRIMFHDLRDSVGLAYADQGSARSRLNELLENMIKSLANLDTIMRPGDVAPREQHPILRSLFERFREPRDPQNEAVEADDYEDPVEGIFDNIEGFEDQ